MFGYLAIPLLDYGTAYMKENYLNNVDKYILHYINVNHLNNILLTTFFNNLYLSRLVIIDDSV